MTIEPLLPPPAALVRRWVTGQAFALILAALLSALAGFVDAINYLRLAHLFASFMSGNSTRLGADIGQGNLADALPVAAVICLFVLGAAAGQVLAGFTGRRHLTFVLAAVMVLLIVAALAELAPEPMVVAMGALNAAMHRAGRVGVSLTFVTGTLVRFGQGLGDFVARRAVGWDWLAQACPWLGMVAGAAAGGAGYVQVGPAVIWVPVAMAGLLAVLSTALPEPG
jgi:uncharacterized membrane protein YoaK (UPF0700 family)